MIKLFEMFAGYGREYFCDCKCFEERDLEEAHL